MGKKRSVAAEPPKELFELQKMTDNPLFEGFALKDAPALFGGERLEDELTHGDEVTATNRVWKARRFAKRWQAPKVVGRVRPFQDYPCVNMLYPAFSRRAGDALRDVLEPNGELLPLDSELGEYYFYNITTVLDVFDAAKAKCFWSPSRPSIAMDIEYFAFHREKLVGQTIFRFLENPVMTVVTDEFVRRVYAAGLNGFQFNKIWPFRRGVYWRMEAKKKDRKEAANKPKIKGDSAVIILGLKGKKPTKVEKKEIARIEKELDAQLDVPSLDAPYFGNYDNVETVGSEHRMFLSCPSSDRLIEKLLPWLKNLGWDGEVRVVKRDGDIHDATAKAEFVDLNRS